MPYVTEEIYMMLKTKDESIVISSYPQYNEKEIYPNEENLIDKIIEDITNIRNLKVVNEITKEALIKIETDYLDIYKFMLKIKEENITSKIPEDYKEYTYKSNNIKISFYQKGKEINKDLLKSEIDKLEKSIEKRKKLLSNENYVNKAPEKIVEQEKQKLKEEEEKLNILKNQL